MSVLLGQFLLNLFSCIYGGQCRMRVLDIACTVR